MMRVNIWVIGNAFPMTFPCPQFLILLICYQEKRTLPISIRALLLVYSFLFVVFASSTNLLH